MKCDTCEETEMVEETIPVFHYDMSGLPNVYLLDQPVRRCPNCNEAAPVFRAIAKLHREIALSVIAHPEKLSGSEVRFLRKHLGYSGDDFAAIMGVRRATVSDWETEKEPIGGELDRLLRMLVAKGDQIADYVAEDLKKITDERAALKPRRFRQTGRTWTLEAPAG